MLPCRSYLRPFDGKRIKPYAIKLNGYVEKASAKLYATVDVETVDNFMADDDAQIAVSHVPRKFPNKVDEHSNSLLLLDNKNNMIVVNLGTSATPS